MTDNLLRRPRRRCCHLRRHRPLLGRRTARHMAHQAVGTMTDLADMYHDAATGGRRAPGRPPADLIPRLVALLAARPDVAGVGLAYLAEAVRSAA